MHLHTLITSSLLSLTLAAPLTKRFVESTPWHLTNIRAFTASPGPTGVSGITFHFCDTNAGLELETECTRYLAPGSGRSPIDPDTFYPCANETVGFKYTGKEIEVQRTYIDPSVGSPATAEFPATWYVAAGGQANTTFEVASDEAGSWAYERELSVPITTLIA